MAENLLKMPRVLAVALFPLALVVIGPLILLLGVYFYIAAIAQGIAQVATAPFRKRPTRTVAALPEPHFHTLVGAGTVAESSKSS